MAASICALEAPTALHLHEAMRELLVGRGFAITEAAGERLAHEGEVAVLAKDERDDDPVVRGACGAVGALEAVEGAVLPLRDIRRRPGVVALFAAEAGGGMDDVVGVNEGTRRDGLRGFADGDAIHGDEVAHAEVMRGELLLGGDFFAQRPALAVQGDAGSGFEIAQGHEGIVGGMDLEDGRHENEK
jgi:hypothetical protein